MNIQFFAENPRRRPRKAGKPIGKFIAIGLAAVVLVAVVLLVINLLSSGGGYSLVDRSLRYQVFDDDTLYFLAGGEKIDSKLDAQAVIHWDAAMDGNVACFTVDEDGDEVLYLLNGEDLLYIAENPTQILMPETGTALAYIADDELSLYSLNKMSAQQVASSVTEISAVSPDGKTVAYVDNQGRTCVYSDGKTYELDSGLAVLSLADSGKYIYCVGREAGQDCLYLYNLKGQVGLVAAGMDLDAACYTNADHDQLIFRAEAKSGYKWYAVKGKELEEDRHTLSGTDLFDPLCPMQLQCYEAEGLTVLGVGDLTDLVFTSRDEDDTYMKLIYLGSGWDVSVLVSQVLEAQIGSDGKTVYYKKSDRVYSITAKAGAQSTELATDVELYEICPDGSGFYYVDSQGIAYYHNSSKTKQLCEKVYGLWVTYDGYALMLVNDNDAVVSYVRTSLYSSKHGGKVTLVDEEFYGWIEACADCTYHVQSGYHPAISAVVSWPTTLYVATKGASFTELGSYELKPYDGPTIAEATVDNDTE